MTPTNRPAIVKPVPRPAGALAGGVVSRPQAASPVSK